MTNIHPALLFAGALLVAISAGCNEKAGPGKKPASPASAVPVAPQAEIVVEGVPIDKEPALKNLLRVDGVMRKGNDYVVALNGQVVKAGEFLRLTVKSEYFILEVMDITSQRILLKATKKDEEGSAPALAATPAPITPP